MTTAAVACPSSETLERLLGETLGDAERAAVESHVEACPACQERLEQLVTVSAPIHGRLTPTPPGTPAGLEPDEDFLHRLRQLPPPARPDPDAPGGASLQELGPYQIL